MCSTCNLGHQYHTLIGSDRVTVKQVQPPGSHEQVNEMAEWLY